MMKISITLLALAAMPLPAQDSTPFAGGNSAFIRD
jgi:hypothetical protein